MTTLTLKFCFYFESTVPTFVVQKKKTKHRRHLNLKPQICSGWQLGWKKNPLVLWGPYILSREDLNLGHSWISTTPLEPRATHMINVTLINPKKICAGVRSNARNSTGQRQTQSIVSVHWATYMYVPMGVLLTTHKNFLSDQTSLASSPVP